MRTKVEWSVSDISAEIPLKSNMIQFVDEKGEFHDFVIIVTKEKVVFGGCCNVGFLESGYLLREEGESLDESLSETLSDLITYYNDGPEYVSRIVVNERM